MTDKPKPVYVIMRKSGAIMTCRNGLSPSTEWGGPYLHILNAVVSDNRPLGSPDEPDKLFLNGKLVVESGLARLAEAYTKDVRDSTKATERAVAGMHTPSWAPDGEKVYVNPPGIDVWTITKKGVEA